MEQTSRKVRQIIDDNFLIPLGLAIFVIGGVTIYLTTMHINVDVHTDQISNLTAAQERYFTHILKIEHDVAHIKGELRSLTKDGIRNR